MAEITVSESNGSYDVTVAEGGSSTTHRVTLATADYDRLHKGDETPKDLIRRSFEFLLTKESKESILGSFNLTLIGQYFPEYEKTISQ